MQVLVSSEIAGRFLRVQMVFVVGMKSWKY